MKIIKHCIMWYWLWGDQNKGALHRGRPVPVTSANAASRTWFDFKSHVLKSEDECGAEVTGTVWNLGGGERYGVPTGLPGAWRLGLVELLNTKQCLPATLKPWAELKLPEPLKTRERQQSSSSFSLFHARFSGYVTSLYYDVILMTYFS